jgi:integrase
VIPPFLLYLPHSKPQEGKQRMTKISLGRDKGSWVITFTYQGSQIRHYSGYQSEERNKLIASAIASDIEASIYDESRVRYKKTKTSKVKNTPTLTPCQAIDRYLKEGGLKPSTEYQYAIAWRLLRNVKTSDESAVLKALVAAGVSNTTLTRLLGCVNAAYKFCGVQWTKPALPITSSKERPCNANSEAHWLSGGEVEAIYNWAETRQNYLQFIKLSLATGARVGEVLALTFEDYDPLQRVLIINKNVTEVGGVQTFNDSTKTGEARHFPVNEALHAILGTKKEGLVVPPFNHRKYFDYGLFKRQFCREFKGRTPYNFRDTFIFNQLFTHGVDIDTVAAWCGNSPQVIRKSYLSRKQIALRITPK